jgi:hypothetical protein
MKLRTELSVKERAVAVAKVSAVFRQKFEFSLKGVRIKFSPERKKKEKSFFIWEA